MLALTRKVMIIMLFDSNICVENILLPCYTQITVCLLDFLPYLPPVPPPLINSQHLGGLHLQACETCAQLLTALQVEANNFLVNSRSRLMRIRWLRKCMSCSVITQKLSSGQKGSQTVVSRVLAAVLTVRLPVLSGKLCSLNC